MKNEIQSGVRILVTAGAGGITVGDPVVVGNKVVIAMASCLENETVVAMTEGVFEVDKATDAVSQGDTLFYDASAKKMTKTAAGNIPAGYAFKSAQSSDATVQVDLYRYSKLVAAVQADSTASTVAGAVADINALLAKLKAAGIMANK